MSSFSPAPLCLSTPHRSVSGTLFSAEQFVGLAWIDHGLCASVIKHLLWIFSFRGDRLPVADTALGALGLAFKVVYCTPK